MAQKVVQPNVDFDLVIVTPDKVLFESKAKRVMLPGYFQELAILPDHTPLYSELINGEVVVETENETRKFPVDTGIVRVKQNKVTVVVGF